MYPMHIHSRVSERSWDYFGDFLVSVDFYGFILSHISLEVDTKLLQHQRYLSSGQGTRCGISQLFPVPPTSCLCVCPAWGLTLPSITTGIASGPFG